MTLNEVRSKYLAFFEKQGHVVIPSSSLVPENDPTTLFTGSGMQPLVPYLLGKNHPSGTRLVDSQKSFRAMDIEEVGDNRHTTFFEMLGNWSLGDYFKQEQLRWFFTFLTEEVGLDPANLYVTTFIGDEKNNIPRDTEAVEMWKTLFAEKGITAEFVEIGSEADGYQKGMTYIPEGSVKARQARIFGYDAKKNWWSRAGVPENMPAGEPGGPDSEVFYDFRTTHDPSFGPECHPNCDCGRFLEIGNSVFMQYIKQQDGTFALLPKQNVDFGGGLERIAAASIGSSDVFQIDIFKNIIKKLEELSGKEYSDIRYIKSFRIVADHLRAAIFIIGDGVIPSNTERGYFARRLIRRAVEHLDRLGVHAALDVLGEYIVQEYPKAYPDLFARVDNILATLLEEERRFRKTLVGGKGEFEKVANKGGAISGHDAFILFTTYGFPLELTKELAQERGLTVDEAAFKVEMEKHQNDSRAGSEQKFKGGLADTSEKTTRLHTAHHLLLKALQVVLGPTVKQRGSNITQERLRIDFSWPEKMTDEQKKEVERLVNEKIEEDLPMLHTELDKTEAEKLGAEHEFGQKYPDRVSIYSLGPKGATTEDPCYTDAFSIEFCGGPHVASTGELAGTGDPEGSSRRDRFKILKEEAVSQGVRRIKAVLQ